MIEAYAFLAVFTVQILACQSCIRPGSSGTFERRRRASPPNASRSCIRVSTSVMLESAF